MAIAGSTSDTSDRSGVSSGQTTPTMPHGSFMASVMWTRLGGVHRAIELIGLGGVIGNAARIGVEFVLRPLFAHTGAINDAGDKFVTPCIEFLC